MQADQIPRPFAAAGLDDMIAFGFIVGADPLLGAVAPLVRRRHRHASPDALGFPSFSFVTGKDGNIYPATKPKPAIFAASASDRHRAADAVRRIGDAAPAKVLTVQRAERIVREHEATVSPPIVHQGMNRPRPAARVPIRASSPSEMTSASL